MLNIYIYVYEITNLRLLLRILSNIEIILVIHDTSYIRIMNVEAYKIYRCQEDVDELILT